MDPRLYDMNVLYGSWLKCKKGVGWKCSVQKYESRVLERINDLRHAVEMGTYKQTPFYEFDIMERGKPRHIKSLYIIDRVLQRVLCDEILMPSLLPHLQYDNGASVKGKGVSFARHRVKQHLVWHYAKYGTKGYILQIDFSKYFDSMLHSEVIRILTQYLEDEDVKNLITDLINSFGGNRGMGIGAQISQVAGIAYPMEIDNFCKVVKGCHCYGRYMDDIYIIHESKEYLREVLRGIKEISDRLGLRLNEKKTHIALLRKGFVFLQMKHLLSETGHITVVPVSKSFVRQRRKMKKLVGNLSREDFIDQYKCWRGNIKKYDCHHSLVSMDRLFSDLLNLHYSDKIPV